MTQALEYSRPAARPPSRVLAVLAHGTLAYPLLLAGSLYAEWFLAWHLLGHPPQPSANDPMDIAGSRWLHPVVGVAILGFLPAACGALLFNTFYVLDRRLRGRRLAVRLLALLALWLGVFALFRYEPYPVMEWWLD